MAERLHPRQERYLGRRPHLHRVTATTWHTASTAFVSLQASLRTTVAASTARQPLVEVRGKRAATGSDAAAAQRTATLQTGSSASAPGSDGRAPAPRRRRQTP